MAGELRTTIGSQVRPIEMAHDRKINGWCLPRPAVDAAAGGAQKVLPAF
jgi:hypothetical protein